VNIVTRGALLARIEAFYDAVPRRATVEHHSPLTLFVRPPGDFPLYARPALGGTAPDVDDVATVRARQRQLGVPEAFEWVDEVTPGLVAAAGAAGLAVLRHPLMLLDPARLPAADPAVRFLAPDDDGSLAADIRAVAAVAFSGSAGGPAERDAARTPRPLSDGDLDALSTGAIARAAIADETGAVCSGSYQRAGDVVEIVGVATLPSARRRGLAGALTAALAHHALARGAELVFLSAGPDAVSVYARLGFTRIATACIAEPPS
jgi:GNAT superfamily N-acetyltransferase